MKSWDTLDSACNIVVDIAPYHEIDKLDMLPATCYYNLRNSIEHLQNRNRNDDIEQSCDIKFLLES